MSCWLCLFVRSLLYRLRSSVVEWFLNGVDVLPRESRNSVWLVWPKIEFQAIWYNIRKQTVIERSSKRITKSEPETMASRTEWLLFIHREKQKVQKWSFLGFYFFVLAPAKPSSPALQIHAETEPNVLLDHLETHTASKMNLNSLYF